MENITSDRYPTATQLQVTGINNAMLQSSDGYASFAYKIFDADGNLITNGVKSVDGDFCTTWDGNYDQAYNYIANYLGVVIL